MSTMQIDQAASGSTLQVAAGDQVNLTLPETRTAGFKWQIVSPETAVFSVKDDGFERAPEVGGTGFHRWTLSALQPGSATLEMAYARSWESSPPKQRFAVTITVGG